MLPLAEMVQRLAATRKSPTCYLFQVAILPLGKAILEGGEQPAIDLDPASP